MTILDLIKDLIKEGHSVEYRKRSDGGYIITSIDKRKYKGGEGNKQARAITGVKVSAKRLAQLNRIRPVKPQLDKDLKYEIQRTQRIWRKNQTKAHKGRISTKKVRWKVKEEGYVSAFESLRKAQKYAQGLAYSENITALIDRVKDLGTTGGYNVSSIITKLTKLGQNIREVLIQKINEIMYDFQDNKMSWEEAQRQIENAIAHQSEL